MKNTRKRRPGVVSVILVNYRGSADTIQCVRTLREIDFPQDRLEIIVVENGSGDDSLEQLATLGDLATIVPSKVNGGFTGGCNLGVSKSSGEFIAFLNNDARPDDQWINAAMDTFAESKDIGAVASKVLDWEGERVDYVGSALTWYGMGYKPHAGEHDRPEWSVEKDVLFGTGAAMFVRAELFEQLGGFDDRYFMFYEDVDLGWRLNLLGYRFRFQPKSLAFHKHHASMEKFGNYFETYLLERNALYTLYKNLDDEALSRSFAAALLLATRRATGRAKMDTTALDLRKSKDDDGSPASMLSKQLLAGVNAIDQVVENLPELAKDRALVQATRTRSDRQLRLLLGNIDEPAYPIESYLEGYDKIVSSLNVLDEPLRRRVLIITGDPIGAKMAGPAIRAWNMADTLADEHDVRLVSMTGVSIESERFELDVVSHHRPASMKAHEKWADVIILQGHALALFPALETTTKVLVIDVYDPLHLEQLEQGKSDNLVTWGDQVSDATDVLNHQLARGDFFLCASERQRHFWLGQMAALGRINPYTYTRDEDLETLIAIAPFGIPAGRPEHTRPALRGVVPGIGVDDKVIIWGGGIYDWFDPGIVIRAVGELAKQHTDLRLFFMGTKHPNPSVPEMPAVVAARALSDELGLTGTHVFFNDSWVAYDDRHNYLLEADLGISTHFQHVETTFSFRTRILDYLWAGLPIVTTEGDSFGDLVREETLGVSVPERDQRALMDAIEHVLFDDASREAARANVQLVRERFVWSSALAPLVEFVRNPRLAADKAPAEAGAKPVVLSSSRQQQTPPRRTGMRRDVDRVAYYLKNGGPKVVVERFAARQQRKRDADNV
ncbi:glycosyltransferase [Plantibacter flavus]|uniref:glycosyltransferase n=1 Tax=Plantibacter flavus TaxID=150123 RepID=UPI003399273E